MPPREILSKGLTSMRPVAPARGGLERHCRKLPGVAAALLVLAWGIAPEAAGQRPETAAAGRVVRQTSRTAMIHWDRVPLRDALARLPTLFDEVVFVDRRVDPQQRISLNVAGAAMDDVLGRIAEETSLGVSQLGSLRYLGPRGSAERLRTVAVVRNEDVAKTSAALRMPLLRRERLSWPRRTEPRGLVTAFAAQRGWRVRQAERIPHDLWTAGGLPELTIAEQLSVLLIGFDLTFEVVEKERALEIVPLEPVTIKRSYRLPSRLGDPETVLQQQLPDVAARVEGTTVFVDGPVEDHERLLELLRGSTGRARSSAPVRKTRQVYTLRVQEQPVGEVLRQLAERLQWPIEIDESALRAAGLSLEKRVTFAVENSSQEELLEAVLRPAGLDFRREGERLRIVPRKSADE